MPKRDEKKWMELNITRLSLISVQRSIPAGYRRWDVEFDDGQHPYRVGCLALPEYGVPHGIDNDIMTALINLFIEQGCPTDNAVTASAYTLLKAAGHPDTGRNYKNLHESLMRLQTTSFLISEGWWDHGRRRWTTATFRYLDQVEFTRPDDAHLDSRSMLRVVLPGEIAKSVRAGYLKPLNARLMQALKQPTTRALYGLLDARRHHPQHPQSPTVDQFDVPLLDWARHCRILDERPDRIRRALDPAHTELIDQGYLLSATYHGRGTKQTVTYVFGQAAAPPDPELVTVLVSHGVSAAMAQKLAGEHGDTIHAALTRMQLLLDGGYTPRSRPAFLVDLIRHPDKYTASAAAMTERDHQAATTRQADAARRLQEAEQQASDAFEESEQHLGPADRAEAALRTARIWIRTGFTTQEYDLLRAALMDGRVDPAELNAGLTSAAVAKRLPEALHELRQQLTRATLQS